MKRNAVLIIGLILLGPSLFAQTKKRVFSIGAALSSPPVFSFNGSSNATGIGIDFMKERYLNSNLSWTLSVGFDYFIGDYSYFTWRTNNMGQDQDSTIRNFATVPLATGLRYYLWPNVYLAGETGFNIGISTSTGTHLLFRPGAGWMIPAGKCRIDLGVRWVYVNQGGGVPESNGLDIGGYHFWSFRAALAF